MSINVFATFNINTTSSGLSQAVLSNDVSKVRQINDAFEKGVETARSWALSRAGSFVDSDREEVTVEIPATAIAELDAIKETYQTVVNCPVYVGVGKKLTEAAKASQVAKMQTTQKIAFYDRDLELKWREYFTKEDPDPENLEKAQYKGIKELQGRKDKEHGLKFDIPIKGLNDLNYVQEAGQHPHSNPSEHFEHKLAAMADPNHLNVKAKKHPMAAAFHKLAAIQETKDLANAAVKTDDFQKVREQTAETLAVVKQQLPVLAQFQATYPDMYNSIMGLVQNVILLAQELKNAEEHLGALAGVPVQKSVDKEEVSPDEEFPEDKVLDKADIPEHFSAHYGLKLPVGTVFNGEMKVKNDKGHASWENLRAGAVASTEPTNDPIMGQSSNPVSSRKQ